MIRVEIYLPHHYVVEFRNVNNSTVKVVSMMNFYFLNLHDVEQNLLFMLRSSIICSDNHICGKSFRYTDTDSIQEIQ